MGRSRKTGNNRNTGRERVGGQEEQAESSIFNRAIFNHQGNSRELRILRIPTSCRVGTYGQEGRGRRADVRDPKSGHQPRTTNHLSGAGTDGNEEGKEEDVGGKISKSGEYRGEEWEMGKIITKMVVMRKKLPQNGINVVKKRN